MTMRERVLYNSRETWAFEPRELKDLCGENPRVRILLGNVYCSYSNGTPVLCPHMAKKRDQNDL